MDLSNKSRAISFTNTISFFSTMSHTNETAPVQIQSQPSNYNEFLSITHFWKRSIYIGWNPFSIFYTENLLLSLTISSWCRFWNHRCRVLVQSLHVSLLSRLYCWSQPTYPKCSREAVVIRCRCLIVVRAGPVLHLLLCNGFQKPVRSGEFGRICWLWYQQHTCPRPPVTSKVCNEKGVALTVNVSLRFTVYTGLSVQLHYMWMLKTMIIPFNVVKWKLVGQC